MASKQFDHLQALSLQRLRARIPSACPLVVTRDAQRGGFLAATLDMVDQCHGRFQVVHAFIDGYVACWRRVRPLDTPLNARDDAELQRRVFGKTHR